MELIGLHERGLLARLPRRVRVPGLRVNVD
jgi:hypothetical protein